jgi:hypothetical protein
MSLTKRIVIIVVLLSLVLTFAVRQAVLILKDGAQAYLFGYLFFWTVAGRYQPSNG